MTAARHILQRLVDAGGSMPRHDFPHASGCSTNQTIWKLREDGLVAIDISITEAGLAHMDAPKTPRKIGERRKFGSALDMIDAALRHPIVTTDEQIEKLKEKVEADRSFGV